jgi:hypothetical protein
MLVVGPGGGSEKRLVSTAAETVAGSVGKLGHATPRLPRPAAQLPADLAGPITVERTSRPRCRLECPTSRPLTRGATIE